MDLKLKEEYVVEIDDVDFSGKMSLLGLARRMQNIAVHHAQLTGLDYYKDCEVPKYYWIVSRVKYVLHKELKRSDKFSLTTYFAGYDKLFWARLFDIKDENNQDVGWILGDYLLVEAQSGKLVRSTDEKAKMEELNFKYEGEQLKKLTVPKDIIAEEKRKARYSEIDINGHMNNIQYINWILDMIPLETYKEQEIATLQINYNKSVMYNDEVNVIIGTVANEEGYRLAGISLDGKTNYFTAHITLRNKEV